MSRSRWTALVGLLLFCALSSQALGQTLAFLDENGAPASAYLEKTRAYVQVTDPAANVSAGQDMVEVQLSTALGGDVELVTLTETGASTGVFRGDIPIVQKDGPPQPGVLETDTLRVPPYGRDTISADYGNGAATATVSLVGSIVKFLDLYGRPATRFAVGETIFIRVVAPLRNTSPYGADQVSFQITAGNGSDSEWLYLWETGPDTGVFETSLPTAGNPPVQGNGVLETAQGQAVQAIFWDSDVPTFSQADATMAASSVELIDAQGKPALFYLESTRAYVRVRDTAADLNPSARDTTTVQMTADLSGDQETVTLQETGTSTGVFEGPVPLLRGPGVPGNGSLETTASSGAPYRFDTLHVTHADGAGNSTDAVDTIGSLTLFLDGYGNEVASYVAGARVYLRVEDHNFNDPSRFDTVTATVQSPGAGDAEAITLVETGLDTGIFEASIPTRTSASGSGDGVLAVQPGQTILAQHVDANNVLASGAQAAVQSLEIRFIDDAGRPTAEVLMNGTARVRVFSPADNHSSTAVETLTVQVSSRDKLDVETMTLNETGRDTGVFEGAIALAATQSTAFPGNGVLETKGSSYYDPNPDEVTALFGGDSASARVIASRIVFIDDLGQETTTFPVGTNVGVRVIEPASNHPEYYDLINDVEIHLPNGSTYYLNLNETGKDTGVFEGRIQSSASGSYGIPAAPGTIIRATRTDPFTFQTVTAQATFTGGRVLFVDAQGQPASVFLESTRTYVRVVDPGANHNGAVAESVTVQLTTAVWNDQESLTLQETGPNTGVFEGSIPMWSGGATAGDGILETGVGNGPPVHDDTLAASYTDSGGLSQTATASTLGYRVWFLDAAGNVVTSYVPGARAYVRLEDHDYNNTSRNDILYVELNSSNGDQEFLEVDETGLTTGIYEGSIPLEFAAAAPGDGRLQAPGDGWISADRQGPWFPAPVYAQIESSSIQIVDDAGQPVSEVLENGTVHVRVDHPDANADPDAVETVSVQIQSLHAGDQETIVLTETGPNTGLFEGSIPLRYRYSTGLGDGFLETQPGFGPFASEEIAASYGAHTATAHTVLVRMSFAGLRGQPVTSYALRSLIRLKVEDLIDNDPGQIDTLNVVMSSLDTSDQEPITLTETGPSTGIFYGSIPSLETSGSSFDGVLWVGAGQTATAQLNSFAGPFEAQVPFNSNYAPVAREDFAQTEQGIPVSFPVLGNDYDPEGTLISLTAVSQGTLGTVTSDTYGYVTYAPVAAGTDTFTYVVADEQGGEALGRVTVTVTGLPVANDDTASVSEDDSVDIPVLANDSDPAGYGLEVSVPAQPAHGYAFVNSNQTVTYTPAADYNGPDSFTYVVADGYSALATATVTVTVTPVNDPPVANGDSATVAEDGTVDVAVLGNDTDVEGDPLSVSAVTQGDHGTVAINPDKTVKYTPEANYNGYDFFTYTVSDGNGGTATATVTITVTPVNDPPVASSDSATVAEDGTVNVAVLGNDTDADGDTLSVSAVTQGAHGTVAINPDKTVKYTPAANYNGSDSFTYTVSDGNGGTATGTVTVTVTAVNDAPVANADSATVAEDGTVNVAALANDTDADGDTLSVASVTQGAHGTVAINPDKTVKYTPAANYNGSDSFTYTVSDGNGGTATGTVTVTVTAVNDAPVANADSATVAEDGTVNVAVLANDTDVDGDTLSVSAVTQGAHGTVAINPDKTVKYTPSANYNGSDSFTYTVSDGNGGSATGTVVINVTPVNDPPVAVNDSASVVAGSAATVSVLANDADIDGPGLSVTGVTQGAHGTVAINAGQTVTYTAALYVGSDSFTYTVSDGAGGTATATVNVTITAPPRITTGIQARYDFNEGSGSTVNDTSGVGTPLNLTIASPSSVTWISGGLRVNTATAISTSGVASKILSAAQASNEITVEAWVSPSSLTLTGPARIAMLMKNASQRNLVFGQSGSRYETQLKTSTGTTSLQSPSSSLTQTLTHVVYTRSSSGAAMWYINGVQVSTQTTTGNLSTWGTDQKLTLSDNWQGSYYLVAVYGRALSGAEVQQNYLAGAN